MHINEGEGLLTILNTISIEFDTRKPKLFFLIFKISHFLSLHIHLLFLICHSKTYLDHVYFSREWLILTKISQLSKKSLKIWSCFLFSLSTGTLRQLSLVYKEEFFLFYHFTPHNAFMYFSYNILGWWSKS